MPANRTTHNSNKAEATDKKKSAKDQNKKNAAPKDPEQNNTSLPEDSQPAEHTTEGAPPPSKPIADQVIDHFTAHWETFKQGFRTDLDNIVKTLGDSTSGLVKKVDTIGTTQVSLQSRIHELETKLQTKDTTEAALITRIETLEKACSKTDPEGYGTKLKKIEQSINTAFEEDGEGNSVIKQPNLDDLHSDVGMLRREVNTISGFVHVMGRDIRSGEHKTTMNTAKLMRNTLIFGGVNSTEEQTAKEAVTAFLTNILRLKLEPDDILDTIKLGTGYKKWVNEEEIQIPPPIKARCTDMFAFKCMQKASSLYGKKNEELGCKYYIKYAMPEAFKAVRDHHASEIKQYKVQNANAAEGAPKTSFYFNGDRFYVNGVAVEQDIKPPSFRDMMSLREETLDAMEKLQFSAAGPIDERDSIFQAFAIKVNSLDDIDLAYMRIRQAKPYADHIVCAYRLKNEDGVKEGGTHDKEYYGDKEILRVIWEKHAVNLAVYVSCEYGGTPLGPRQFEIIQSIAADAIDDLEPEVITAEEEPSLPRPLPQRERKFNRQRRGQGARPGRGRGGNAGFRRGRGTFWSQNRHHNNNDHNQEEEVD